MTSSGKELVTFRFVAQLLHHGPQYILYLIPVKAVVDNARYNEIDACWRNIIIFEKSLIQNKVDNVQYINDGIERYYFHMLIRDIILSDYSQFMRRRIQHILKHTSGWIRKNRWRV